VYYKCLCPPLPEKEKPFVERERERPNRDNLHLKYSRDTRRDKNGRTKDRTYLRSGHNDKDGRDVFTFTLTFVPNESIRYYMPDMRSSRPALCVFLSLMISALCHFHLVRFIVRFVIPRAFDTPPGPQLLRCFCCALYAFAFRTPDTTDGRHFRVQLRKLSYFVRYTSFMPTLQYRKNFDIHENQIIRGKLSTNLLI